MSEKRILVWFRNDLRLHDNPALHNALKKSDKIVAVYCFDRRLLNKNSFGWNRTGNFRLKFLFESIHSLQKNFAAQGGELILTIGHPEEEIARLANFYKVNSVFYNSEPCSEERSIELALEKNLNESRIDWSSYWHSTLVNKEDLPFSIKNLPNVFTKYRHQVELECTFHTPTPFEQGLKTIGESELSINELRDILNYEELIDDRAAIHFIGGEQNALSRLDEFIWQTNAIATYKETRNGLIGKNYSSKLSPWLAVGAISPRLIVKEIERYENEVVKNESTYWMIFELLWRDFFRFTAYKAGVDLFKLNGIIGKPTIQKSRDLGILLTWINGETGDEFVDANMRELKLTGWMSNRGRQNVASYFVHDLNMDWRLGAEYFEHQLIDYDPASNWCNWAYLAGVGNDPRTDRKFNTQKQANDYDKNHEYRRIWL
jgi:deoxyribodipyrimidine photo-lyase